MNLAACPFVRQCFCQLPTRVKKCSQPLTMRFLPSISFVSCGKRRRDKASDFYIVYFRCPINFGLVLSCPVCLVRFGKIGDFIFFCPDSWHSEDHKVHNPELSWGRREGHMLVDSPDQMMLKLISFIDW